MIAYPIVPLHAQHLRHVFVLFVAGDAGKFGNCEILPTWSVNALVYFVTIKFVKFTAYANAEFAASQR